MKNQNSLGLWFNRTFPSLQGFQIKKEQSCLSDRCKKVSIDKFIGLDNDWPKKLDFVT